MLQLGRYPRLAQETLRLDLGFSFLRVQGLVDHLTIKINVATGKELGRSTLSNQPVVGILQGTTLPVHRKYAIRVSPPQRRFIQRRFTVLIRILFITHYTAK